MSKQNTDRPKQKSSERQRAEKAFPIVGIGASAGGLRAFENFFDALPDSPGMAFVLVQHLDPTHESYLADLLQRHSKMSVRQIDNGCQVEPDSVYVIPPGKALTIENGRLVLAEPDKPRGQRAFIDTFMRSLAVDQGERAVCVILSGTGSDGSIGLKRVKERGGLVLVQDPEEAEHDGMPSSALSTGLADLWASSGELARKLVEFQRNSRRSGEFDPGQLEHADLQALSQIIAQIRMRTDQDFSHYKRSTTLRRVHRRMQLRDASSMQEYLPILRSEAEEARALMKDFLISVTNFFRDPSCFQVIETRVIPELFKNRRSRDSLRVWIPGCATGEEAYSLAMLLAEYAAKLDAPPQIQVFASDLDEDALAYARLGVYPEAIETDIDPDRLQRHFTRVSNGYKIDKRIQDMVLFAHQNILRDPPFSRLDLVSCRNLLIYLDRKIQHEVFRIFHWALNEEAILFLGNSETTETGREYFLPYDSKYCLHRRKSGRSQMPMPPLPAAEEPRDYEQRGSRSGSTRGRILADTHGAALLEHYIPASALVDEHCEIRHLHGDIGRFLRPSEGEPTHNLLQLARPELRADLRAALFQVFKRGQSDVIRHLQIKRDSSLVTLNLIVKPVDQSALQERLALVVFEDTVQASGSGTAASAVEYSEGQNAAVEQLEEDLKRTKQRLSTVIEEYETSNEELKASNEELQSMNEELRSTSEELETSKEELQSTNEELETVNSELKFKIDELNGANSDLENLMAATDIGTLFLDVNMGLKRYTPAATTLFNIITSDLGRPFAHISHKIDHEDLPGMAEEVLRSLLPREEEIRGRDGRCYLMKMTPYRTLQNRIDGVVVAFVDISARKRVHDLERQRGRYQATIAELRQQALQGVDLAQLMDMAVNRVAQVLDVPLCKILELNDNRDEFLLRSGIGWKKGLVGQATVGTELNSQAGYTLQSAAAIRVTNLETETRFNGPALLRDHGVTSGMSVIVQGSRIPYGVFGVHSRSHREFGDDEVAFLQSAADLLGSAIEKQHNEEALRRSRAELAAMNDALEDRVKERTDQVRKLATSLNYAEQEERLRIAQVLHDDLQQLLYSTQVHLHMLQQKMDKSGGDAFKRIAAINGVIERAITVARTLTVDLSPPVLKGEGLAEALKWLATHMEEYHGLRVEVRREGTASGRPGEVQAPVFQLIRELLFNVVKHADVKQATVVLRQENGELEVRVEDLGRGFNKELLEDKLSPTRGLGIPSVRERLSLLGGSLEIITAPGEGTQAIVRMHDMEESEGMDINNNESGL